MNSLHNVELPATELLQCQDQVLDLSPTLQATTMQLSAALQATAIELETSLQATTKSLPELGTKLRAKTKRVEGGKRRTRRSLCRSMNKRRVSNVFINVYLL
jgi:hypothetical protein